MIVTDAQHSRAVPQVEEINDRLHDRVQPLIEQQRVPIMGGFVGATREGITTTIGRGGSDFSAALVGAGLNAERIEIWTDVDGMKTTDPRICPDARRIKLISFEEAAELAYFGAKVLHPATVLPAVEKNIPVLVLNSRNPSNEGTRILARTPRSQSLFKAIAAKNRITVIDIVAARMLMAHGFLAKVFEIFARHRCAVDVVSTSEVSISLTVDSNEAIPQIAADLEKLAFVKYSGPQGDRLPGGREPARHARSGGADLRGHPRHQRAHDFAGRIGDQPDLRHRRSRRSGSRPAAACEVFCRCRSRGVRLKQATAEAGRAGAGQDRLAGRRSRARTRASGADDRRGCEPKTPRGSRRKICATSMW